MNCAVTHILAESLVKVQVQIQQGNK